MTCLCETGMGSFCISKVPNFEVILECLPLLGVELISATISSGTFSSSSERDSSTSLVSVFSTPSSSFFCPPTLSYYWILSLKRTYIFIGVKIPLHILIEYFKNINVRMAIKMDHPILILVIDVEETNLVTQERQLDGFLQQAFLALAVGHL